MSTGPPKTWWTTIQKKQGLPPFEPAYQLRHLAGSLILAKTGNTETTRKFMGHRSKAMVRDVYGHLLNQLDPATASLNEDLEPPAAVGNSEGTKANSCTILVHPPKVIDFAAAKKRLKNR